MNYGGCVKPININVPFPWCRTCPKFTIVQHADEYIAGSGLVERCTSYSCEHENFCSVVFKIQDQYNNALV